MGSISTMKEKSGISDGKLHLSQGITRKLATGTSGQFTEIPVIDLSALHSPSATEKDMEHLVQELRSACTNVGFFVAKNHGMDWKIVERAFSALEQFFGLPEETKMKVHQSKSKFYQGYEQAYYTNMNGLKKGDLKEAFASSYDPNTDPNGVGDAMPALLRRENNWPSAEDAPDLKESHEAYRLASLKLMRNLAGAMALAIGEKATFFEPKTTYASASTRALYYPPQEGSDEEETGFGAHTDVQLLTLIAQQPYDIQALQVLNAQGEWISPSLEPESFVVNLADMMARLTNDTFLSTVHRVINKNPQPRYSIAFFFGLNGDELVTTLPQFVTKENPLCEGYEKGETSYEHVIKRLRSSQYKLNPTSAGMKSAAMPFGMTKVDGVLVEGL